jgi:FtsH-binding integral membrane protein
LLLITLLSYLLAKRSLTSSNPHAFVRGVYSGIILKLFVSMIAAFVYISIYKRDLNKPAFFTLMGLYLVYTFIEVSILTKDLKQQKNA